MNRSRMYTAQCVRIQKMGLDKERMDEIVRKFRTVDKDTSSADIEIGIYSELIQETEEEFRVYPDDIELRLILITYVGERRRLLNYLHQVSVERYLDIIEKLGLEK
jgi:small subunit ribosomal protein S15